MYAPLKEPRDPVVIWERLAYAPVALIEHVDHRALQLY